GRCRRPGYSGTPLPPRFPSLAYLERYTPASSRARNQVSGWRGFDDRILEPMAAHWPHSLERQPYFSTCARHPGHTHCLLNAHNVRVLLRPTRQCLTAAGLIECRPRCDPLQTRIAMKTLVHDRHPLTSSKGSIQEVDPHRSNRYSILQSHSPTTAI